MLVDWMSQYCENGYTTQAIYRSNAVRLKLPMELFTELELFFFNFCGNPEDIEQPK